MLRSLPAKPRLEPTWYAAPDYAWTYGPQVCDVNAMGDFAPDPEQAALLDPIFGVAASGLSAVFEADLIAPRQNLKTGLVCQCITGWMVVSPNVREVVYSAHDLKAAQEAFETAAGIFEASPALSKLLAPGRGDRPGLDEGRGSWAIRTRDGRRARFMTRGRKSGRALGGDRVVLDEGFAVTAAQMGSLLPVLTARPDPQYLLPSSAGMVDSDVLIDARDRGRAGGTERQLYAEFGDRFAGEGCKLGLRCSHRVGVEGCVLDDEQRWAEIMPALGGRAKIETIRGLRRGMPPLEFARECMVWWDVDGGDRRPPAIDLTTWAARENREVPRPERAAVFVDVAPDRSWTSIAAAGAGTDGRTVVLVMTAPGVAWAAEKIAALKGRDDVAVVGLYPQSQAGALLPTLVKLDTEVEPVTATFMGQACALLQGKVRDDELEHVGQRQVAAAVKNAITRWSANGEVEIWDRRDRSVDISPVVAASGAVALWEQLVGSQYDIEDSYL